MVFLLLLSLVFFFLFFFSPFVGAAIVSEWRWWYGFEQRGSRWQWFEAQDELNWKKRAKEAKPKRRKEKNSKKKRMK